MKANELMIGDWVYDTLSQTYIKVNRNCFETNHLNGICYVENLVPIPLKRVHLAKNGFTANETDETFIYEDGYEVRINFDCGSKELGLEPYIDLNINFSEKHLSMLIENLHQLQQAMRIMGCDKEIIL